MEKATITTGSMIEGVCLMHPDTIREEKLQKDKYGNYILEDFVVTACSNVEKGKLHIL